MFPLYKAKYFETKVLNPCFSTFNYLLTIFSEQFKYFVHLPLEPWQFSLVSINIRPKGVFLARGAKYIIPTMKLWRQGNGSMWQQHLATLYWKFSILTRQGRKRRQKKQHVAFFKNKLIYDNRKKILILIWPGDYNNNIKSLTSLYLIHVVHGPLLLWIYTGKIQRH